MLSSLPLLHDSKIKDVYKESIDDYFNDVGKETAYYKYPDDTLKVKEFKSLSLSRQAIKTIIIIYYNLVVHDEFFLLVTANI